MVNAARFGGLAPVGMSSALGMSSLSGVAGVQSQVSLNVASPVPSIFTSSFHAVTPDLTGRPELVLAPSALADASALQSRAGLFLAHAPALLLTNSDESEEESKEARRKKNPQPDSAAGETESAEAVAANEEAAGTAATEYVTALFVVALQSLVKAANPEARVKEESIFAIVQELTTILSKAPVSEQPKIFAQVLTNIVNSSVFGDEFMQEAEALQIATLVFNLLNKGIPVEKAAAAVAQIVTKYVHQKMAMLKGGSGESEGATANKKAEAPKIQPITIAEIKEAVKEIKVIEVGIKRDVIVQLSPKVTVQVVSNPSKDKDSGRALNKCIVKFHIFADSDDELNETLLKKTAILVNGHVVRQHAREEKAVPFEIVTLAHLTEGVVNKDEKGNGILEIYHEGVLYRFLLPFERKVGF